jgi:hypothetical protein
MKKLNLICASIALLVAGGANAGQAVSTATKIAVENFGGSAATQNTLAVLGAPISYSMSSITAVNSGSVVYFTIRLTGGKFAGTPTATNFAFAGQSCVATAASVTAPNCVVTPSTDKTTIKVAVTTAASYTLGLGAFSWTPAAADIDTVNTTLAAVGGTVSASIGLVTINPTAIEATDTQATIDTPLATGNLAVGVKAINGVVAASSYAGKIDLTASPAASNYTTAGYAILGQYTFTDVAAAAAKIRTGASNYTLANNSTGAAANTGASVTVTPGTGQAFPIGAVLSLSSSATCASALTGSTIAAILSTNASTAKTMATTDVVTTGTPYFVCMTAPSATNTATPIQATIAATVTNTVTTTDSIGAASGNGYSLGYNGSTVDVQTYWPGGLSAYGFNSYLRITNTGSVTAAISAQHFTTVGALTGTSTVLAVAKLPTGTLAAGQSVLIPSSQIDGLIGVAPSGLESGRIRISAPTDGLRVQSLLQSSAGELIEFNNKVSGGNQQ